MVEEVIPYIAALAVRRNGDARYAIDLLRASAKVAVRRGRSKITISEVDEAGEEI